MVKIKDSGGGGASEFIEGRGGRLQIESEIDRRA